ncbi:SCO0607 family lipoprotein [Streptomyces sp. NPDC058291]|uniref:SCO0607 family lipoprotein n=1 Tax=Streptomyces sp. NPDC058291 TaxID=3346427 RepID=UPI0036E3396A
MNLPRSTSRAATAPRPRRIRIAAALAGGAAAVVALTGCSGLEYRENICGNGEYPVLSVGDTGSSCVPDGDEPPAGSVRYPKGKVPTQVDDKWDLYWNTHTLDKDGNIVTVPDAG